MIFNQKKFITDDQVQLLNNMKDNNYSISTVHNEAFTELKKSVVQIQKLLENVHVDGNTIKNLNMEIEDLNDIAEDLHNEFTPLHFKINNTETEITATKDAFDDLYENFYEFRESLNILKKDEEDLKQGSVDGALNITRESIERIKRTQQMMAEIHGILKEISLACNSLTVIQSSYENITTETNNNVLHATIFNELLTNYSHFNAKMCQVVNVTCQLQNCSDIFCMSKVKTDLKEKVELLNNGLKELKTKAKEFDRMQETFNKLQYEYRLAKKRNEESVLEVKAKLVVFNNTQYEINDTIDKLKDLENTAVTRNEIKNLTEKILAEDFLENDEYLKELVQKIDDELQTITEVHKIMREAEIDEQITKHLLIKAMNAR